MQVLGAPLDVVYSSKDALTFRKFFEQFIDSKKLPKGVLTAEFGVFVSPKNARLCADNVLLMMIPCNDCCSSSLTECARIQNLSKKDPSY